MTDTRATTFIDQMSAWYDKKTQQEVLNLRLWEQLKVGREGGREPKHITPERLLLP